jgi:hypothetical protein
MASKKYVVLAPFAGVLTRGDVVTKDELPGPAAEMVEQGAIREATSDEGKATHVAWYDLKDAVPEPVAPEEVGGGATGEPTAAAASGAETNNNGNGGNPATTTTNKKK